jgi:hypothetical protein
MFNTLTEKMDVVNVLVPASRAMNTSTSVINLKGYAGCSFLIQKGAGAVGTATITVAACDDTTPSNSTAIAYKYRRMVAATNANAWGTLTDAAATGFVTTAAADDMYEIVVDPDAVGKASVNGAVGYSYVRLTMAQVDATATLNGITAILSKARYAGATPVSAVA